MDIGNRTSAARAAPGLPWQDLGMDHLTNVTAVPAADSTAALAHFSALLAVETDCWDVHEAMAQGAPGFVLAQASATAQSFAQEHIPGAIHLPHANITEQVLQAWPKDTLFVVYCAGPHCNAADRAAVKLAELGRPVKKMIGGKTGWLDEGFSFAGTASAE
jgi:rhodanese-related sulfurtransferase